MNYHKISREDILALKQIVEEKNLLTREQIGEDYSHDELGGITSYPDVLIRAGSTEEVSAVMKYAYDHNIPVVVRGSGTGLVGAAVALYGGIMLETTQMKVYEIAGAVGYSSSQYFSQVLLQRTRKRPLDYRRANTQ